jgi:hypothetical protein
VDAEIWWDCYEKLTKAYQKPRDTEQSKIYFEALRNFPNGVVVEAVGRTIREAKHWPNVAEIRDRVQGVSAGLAAPASICDRCHGNYWIEAPDEEHHGRMYPNYVRRCPQCHAVRVPEPAL